MFTKVSIYVIIYLSIARVILCCAGEYNMQTNGNRRRHWAGGFTLSEILITLVILGFIGALGVPMLGQQKVKKPLEVKSKHGTIECMWLNGQVKAWVSDNEENTGGHFDDALTDGTACYFTVPTANIYVLQAVGAGGTGAAGMSGRPSYYSTTVSQRGSIPTDQRFYAAITDKSVPEWVRANWNKQWTGPSKYVKYTLESPTGASGKAYCKPVVIVSEECDRICEVDIAENCPSGCRADITGKGGASGYNGKIVVSSPINFETRTFPNGRVEYIQSDSVTYKISKEETTLQIGEKSATFRVSGNGEDSKLVTSSKADDGKNGEDVNDSYLTLIGMNKVGAISSLSRQLGGTGCGDISGRPAKMGSISNNDPAEIAYYSPALAINARFGVAGSPGSVSLKMLEKLPSSTQLKLVPARSSGAYGANISSIYMKNSDGAWKLFTEAASGSSGWGGTSVLPINGQEDLPFPATYYPNSFFPAAPNLTIASGAGYTSYIASSGYMLGLSGAGAHPIVNWVGGRASRVINNVSVGSTSLSPISLQDAVCYDGSEPVDGACGSGNNSGNPGAVVVSW